VSNTSSVDVFLVQENLTSGNWPLGAGRAVAEAAVLSNWGLKSGLTKHHTSGNWPVGAERAVAEAAVLGSWGLTQNLTSGNWPLGAGRAVAETDVLGSWGLKKGSQKTLSLGTGHLVLEELLLKLLS
jgi:hypothetical protein